MFAQAFTFTGGNRNDMLNLDGATLIAGTIYELGNDLDTLTMNSDAVANVVRTAARTVIMRSPSAMMLHQQIRPALSREVTPLTTMARLGMLV